MKRLLIKNAMIIDESSEYHHKEVDIYIENGVIKKIGTELNEPGEIFDASTYLVSPGFIDAHVHCYYGKTAIGIGPAEIGVKTGVTSMIDAGTSGADTISDFYKRIIQPSDERVFVLLNTASEGLRTLSELACDDAIDEDKIKAIVEKYQHIIVGLKARASSSVLLDKGIAPIIKSKEIASNLGLPLVVHIGNAPPNVEEVLECTNSGDVITHCYHNKVNGLFLDSGQPKSEVLNAIDRGVLFDIGHGSSSFSFEVAERALLNDFRHDLIGSDIYDKNINTVVKSLIHVMNKVLVLGYSLDEVVGMVTWKPAKHFKLKGLGSIKENYLADFTVYKLDESEACFKDSVGTLRKGLRGIEARYAIVNGKIFRTENGGN